MNKIVKVRKEKELINNCPWLKYKEIVSSGCMKFQFFITKLS